MFVFKSWKCAICFVVLGLNVMMNCKRKLFNDNPRDQLTRVNAYDTGYPFVNVYDKETLFVMPAGLMVQARTAKLDQLKCGFLFIVKLHMRMSRNLIAAKDYKAIESYAPSEVVSFTEEVVQMINVMLDENYWHVDQLWLVHFYAQATKVHLDSKRHNDGTSSNADILEMHEFVFGEITDYLQCDCDRKNAFNYDYGQSRLATRYPSVWLANAHESVPVEAFALRKNKKLLKDLMGGVTAAREKTDKHTGHKFYNRILYFSRTDTNGRSWFCTHFIDRFFSSEYRQIACANIEQLSRRGDLLSLADLQCAIIDVIKIIILRLQWRFVLFLNRSIADGTIADRKDCSPRTDRFVRILTRVMHSTALDDDPVSVDFLSSLKCDDLFDADKRDRQINSVVNNIKHEVGALSETYGLYFMDECINDKSAKDGLEQLKLTGNFLRKLGGKVTLVLGERFKLQCVRSFAKMVNRYAKNMTLKKQTQPGRVYIIKLHF